MGEEDTPGGFIPELLRGEGSLWARMHGVVRLDSSTYAEIAGDPSATPQAFVLVLATSLVVGLGQLSLAGMFIGMAWALVLWLLIAGLLWSAGAILVGEKSHYAPLLRCLGFAYTWIALFLGYELPWIGGLFGLAAFGLCVWSNVLAVRSVLELSTERAAALCLGALGAPMVLLWAVFG